MLVDGQKVKVICRPNNRIRYENLGHKWKYNSYIEVNVEDLPENRDEIIQYICDHCEKTKEKSYRLYISARKNNKIDVCDECNGLNRSKNIESTVVNYNKLQIYKDLLDGRIKSLPSGFITYINQNDLSLVVQHFASLMIANKEIDNLEQLPQVLRQKHLIKYKLISFCAKYDIYELINCAYPEKWVPWQFFKVRKDYWSNDDNVIKACKWLVEKLFHDKIINKMDDIPNLTGDIFKKYKLEGLLQTKFNCSPYQFWDFYFGSKWYEWEYKMTPRWFWTKEDNRNQALRQLAEIKLNLTTMEIPSRLTYSYLVENHPKFAAVCDEYYSSNIFTWIKSAYPNTFSNDQFNSCVAIDGVVLDSEEERHIHELLIKQFNDVKYYDNNVSSDNKWHNDIENENYVADWLVNNKIIIEYFGWYNKFSYGKNKIFTDYIDKANRKIKYFSSLKEYKFVALFPIDIKNNMQGIKEKLNMVF